MEELTKPSNGGKNRIQGKIMLTERGRLGRVTAVWQWREGRHGCDPP